MKNVHGDSSGVRGAAWLWREEEVPALPAEVTADVTCRRGL
jgi:hypothetical protein